MTFTQLKQHNEKPNEFLMLYGSSTKKETVTHHYKRKKGNDFVYDFSKYEARDKLNGRANMFEKRGKIKTNH